jgi:hypothetical protein
MSSGREKAGMSPPASERVFPPGESFFGYTKTEWQAIVLQLRPSTPDDCTITGDGRRLDTKEKLLAYLDEVNEQRARDSAEEATISVDR